MLIAVDDPSFTYFIGLCLLRRQRDRLLLADSEKIPEIVMQMNFNGEEEIDSVIVEAVSLHKNTPRSAEHCHKLSFPTCLYYESTVYIYSNDNCDK